MNNLWKVFKAWLPFAVVILVLSGLAYVLVQQNYRQSANDPQIQIAEDVATAISGGTPADQIVPAEGSTEMAKTLSPFVQIYGDDGKIIGSSILVDGKNPTVPAGVFDYVKKHGQDRFTWQPKKGVRSAAVMTHFTGVRPGFVLAGRSLREVEIREQQALYLAGIGALASLVISFLVLFLLMKTGESGEAPKTEVVVVEEDIAIKVL